MFSEISRPGNFSSLLHRTSASVPDSGLKMSLKGWLKVLIRLSLHLFSWFNATNTAAEKLTSFYFISTMFAFWEEYPYPTSDFLVYLGWYNHSMYTRVQQEQDTYYFSFKVHILG